MGSYEHDLAQWIAIAKKDPKEPIKNAVATLKQARDKLNQANLKNRTEKLQGIGLVFDEATVLFEPQMTLPLVQKLRPICSGFDVALSTYNDAVKKPRGPFRKCDQITQQELDTFKRDAGGMIDKLIKWFEALP